MFGPFRLYKTDSYPESTPFLTEGVPQTLYACPGPGAYMLFGCAPHCEGEVRGICFFYSDSLEKCPQHQLVTRYEGEGRVS